MRLRLSHRARQPRRGAAAVELAVVLPVLAFLFVLGVDFARIFYYSLTLNNCARNGALFACEPVINPQNPYTSTTQAALADATNLQPTPTVSSTSSGDYVEVTVSYQFHTISRFPGVPDTWDLARKVRMKKLPVLPN
jgi:Flp pilus assembly protein TadG